jgi:DNA processing protein
LEQETTPHGLFNEQQLIDWLRLVRTEGVGPKTFQSLINQFGGAADALNQLPELSLRRTGRRIQPPPVADIERELAAARRMGARFLARGQRGYPKPLAVLDSSPPVIAVLGPLNLEARQHVAIVGSRNASLPGLKMAEKLATGIGRHGYNIVSGLARGIDARAHDASVATGTVAVLAGGLDRLYPEENRALFDRIAADGAVISEMPFGWTARGRDFPRRNRIVSGLCLGTIVVEANQKSGSLITARFALEQGRTVYAVPGSPFDPRAEGPNSLIRQGAMLVTSAEDVIEDLKGQRDPQPRQMSMLEGAEPRETPLWDEADWLGPGLSAPTGPEDPPFDGWHEDRAQDLQARILNLLTAAPSDPDDLTRALGVSAREVQIALFEMEADARIQRTPRGGIVIKTV